jgi:hypothetical protein
MNEVDKCAHVWYKGVTVSSGATSDVAFDTTGFERANVLIHAYCSAATQTATFLALNLVESDTATVATSMSAIVAFTGAAATSTSAGFVWPVIGDATDATSVIEFQVDLLKRKKYMGITVTPSLAAVVIEQHVILSNPKISCDTEALKNATDLKLNANAAVYKLVQG